MKNLLLARLAFVFVVLFVVIGACAAYVALVPPKEYEPEWKQRAYTVVHSEGKQEAAQVELEKCFACAEEFDQEESDTEESFHYQFLCSECRNACEDLESRNIEATTEAILERRKEMDSE